MASIKVKYRPSANKDKEGVLYYQIIHNRSARQISTTHRLYAHEWNNEIIISTTNRRKYLQNVKECVARDIKQLQKIISQCRDTRTQYSADDIVRLFRNRERERFLFGFMHEVISRLKQMGKLRTSETYSATLRSFMQFRHERDISLGEIDSDLIIMYEAYLRARGVTRNTSSFYMRVLRAVYNRAVEKELTINRNPFRHVYTGVEKTPKRAISLNAVKQIKNLILPEASLDFARDMFLFSFYTRGMSFIDMAYLKKDNLRDGTLSYCRRKTGQQMFVRWEKCMQDIVAKHKCIHSDYLLPIIKPHKGDERTQYKNAMYLVNRKLKTIGKMIALQQPLTMYTARHSWASAAKFKNVPLAVICEGMGHDSETTTQIYLASLDTAVVDEANSVIINSI